MMRHPQNSVIYRNPAIIEAVNNTWRQQTECRMGFIWTLESVRHGVEATGDRKEAG